MNYISNFGILKETACTRNGNPLKGHLTNQDNHIGPKKCVHIRFRSYFQRNHRNHTLDTTFQRNQRNHTLDTTFQKSS